ncbi:MAG: hypothetical protein RIC95_12770 [Vicingaceae bacterium]
MKKISLSLSLIFLFTLGFAQEDMDSKENAKKNNFYPQAGDFGTSIVVNGLIDNISFESNQNRYGSNFIFGRYYLEDDLVLRMGLGLIVNSTKNTTADSVGNTLEEVENTKTNYLLNFSGGIEKHLGGTKRLDPYLFSQLDLTFIGKSTEEIITEETSAAGTSKVEQTIKEDGGIAIGLGGGVGFNYFIAPRLSIGSELSMGLMFVNEGGTVSDNTVTTPVNGSASTNFTSREDKTRTLSLGVMPNALVHFSYFF